jgi:RNA methyltransferase, TrmH family
VLTAGNPEPVFLCFDEERRLWEHLFRDEGLAKVAAYSLDSKTFSAVTDTDNPQGILAVCRLPEPVQLDEFEDKGGVIVATDRIQDPGNMGTIIRTACWFGATGLLVGNGTVDPFHPKVVRSTAGAVGGIKYCQGDLGSMLRELEKKGWRVLLLDAGEKSISIKSVSQIRKCVLVIGNEANGIDPELGTEGREQVRIDPASGKKPVESLNASIAAAIGLFALQERMG